MLGNSHTEGMKPSAAVTPSLVSIRLSTKESKKGTSEEHQPSLLANVAVMTCSRNQTQPIIHHRQYENASETTYVHTRKKIEELVPPVYAAQKKVLG